MAIDIPMRFGVFASPIHPSHCDPTFSLTADIALMETLDRLGYDEAWIGEHHSSGWEIVAAPEVFIAHVLARTQHIRLGSGVVSLPYHHPFTVAERAVLLDHLGRGRTMLGVGPGANPSDAEMFGIDPLVARARMEESLEVVVALLRGERVTRETDWFTLRDGCLQLGSYSDPHVEVAISALKSPAGASLAGRLGASLLSLNATEPAMADVLAGHWRVMEEEAELHGTVVDRRGWRLVGPMFLAETVDEARRAVARGLREWCHFFTRVFPLIKIEGDVDDAIDWVLHGDFAVIGTPDDAIAQIEKLQEITGGFGTFLLWTNDWAAPAATERSYELFAREVMPVFRGSTRALLESEHRTIDGHEHRAQVSRAALARAVEQYEERRPQ